MQEGKKDGLLADQVEITLAYKAHDRVILSFLQKVQGLARPNIHRSRYNIGQKDPHMYDQRTRGGATRNKQRGLVERSGDNLLVKSKGTAYIYTSSNLAKFEQIELSAKISGNFVCE